MNKYITKAIFARYLPIVNGNSYKDTEKRHTIIFLLLQHKIHLKQSEEMNIFTPPPHIQDSQLLHQGAKPPPVQVLTVACGVS